MKKYGLIGLAIALIAGLALLVIMLRSGSRGEAEPALPGETSRAPAEPASRAHGEKRLQPIVGENQPAREPAVEPSGEPAVRRHVRPDGVIVRDHRSGDREPDLTRAITRHPSLAKLSAETVLQIHNAVRPIVDKCAKGLEGDRFGDRPTARVDIIVDISGEMLTVGQAAVKASDVPEDIAESLKRCIQGPAERFSLALEGAEDLFGHTVTLPYLLKR